MAGNAECAQAIPGLLRAGVVLPAAPPCPATGGGYGCQLQFGKFPENWGRSLERTMDFIASMLFSSVSFEYEWISGCVIKQKPAALGLNPPPILFTWD